MKILFITQWFSPESGAIHGLPLAKFFQSRGHDVEVITGFPNYPTGKIYPGYKQQVYKRENLEGVSLIRVPLYPSHDKSALRRILNYVSFSLSSATIGLALCKKPDVVYVYHPPPTVGLAALLLKLVYRVPYVYHIADMWPESVVESGMVGSAWKKQVIGNAISAWCNTMYRYASAITVLSPGFATILHNRGVTSSKVHSIYNWADEQSFRPEDPDRATAREAGIPDGFVVLYAGNLGPFQGLETVLYAAQLLKHRSEIKLVIAGTGHEERRLHELARSLGLSNVYFLGRQPVSNMPKINALADVHLVHLRDMPFFRATIPSKIQVGLASGKPLLIAVAGDASHLIDMSGGGVSCPPQDPEAMAAQIERLYDLGPDQLQRMGARGHQFYQEELALSVGGKQLEDLLVNAVQLR